MKDDYQVEAKNKQQAIKKYLKQKDWGDKIAVYDSLKNRIMGGERTICVQEGWLDGDCKYIRGRRGFYKICDKYVHPRR